MPGFQAFSRNDFVLGSGTCFSRETLERATGWMEDPEGQINSRLFYYKMCRIGPFFLFLCENVKKSLWLDVQA